MTRIENRRMIAALLLVTLATGTLDAVSLLHFKTFTGYMTGTVILIGIHFAGGADLAGPGLIALSGFSLGAIAGGRLVRRRHPPPKLVGEVLLGVASLVASASVLDGLTPPDVHFAVIAALAFAMGLQTSATRHAGIADMSMPAATMILHGLAHDSRLAGGTAERAWRRVGVLTGLLVGAAVGASLSNLHVWLGLLATASFIAAAGAVLRYPLEPRHL